ncbi:MAG: hypothetical protein ACHQSE_14490 [Gemmatimonadales bacterium]
MTVMRRWWGVAPVALLVMLVWPERAFVPIWDGNVYAQCIVDAARTGLDIHSLRCGGHQSQLYMGLLALSQVAFPSRIAAIVATNLVLAVGALAAFAAVLRRLIPGDDAWIERALIVVVLAVHPLIAATLLQVNPDFGVYVFFAMVVAALAWRRYALCAVAGVMLCFSKETGALVYAVALGLHLLFMAAEGGGTLRARTAAALRAAAPAIVPLVLFAAFIGWWAATQPSYAIWNQGIQERPLTGIRWFDFDDVIFRSYAAIIFVLGFAWIPAAAIAGDLARGALRAVRHLGDRALPGVDARFAAYIAALAAALAYLLTVYRTWSFPRYFVVLAPLLIITAYVSVVRLGAAPRLRRAALALFAGVLLSSNHASWDPVSRALFGTLSLGESSAYDVSGIAHDFRVTDADHLCYNLQFTGFHWALNAMYAALKPTGATTIVFSRFNRWGLWAPLDARTFGRVTPRPGTVTPDYADETMIAARRERKPRELWLVEQPNDADTLAVEALRRFYSDSGSTRYTAGGLTITARHLVRRDAPVLASGGHR